MTDIKDIFNKEKWELNKGKKNIQLAQTIGRYYPINQIHKDHNDSLDRIESSIQKEFDELLETLKDVMFQACWDDVNQVFDSLALSYYADALRLLDKYHLVKIKTQYGRRVIAEV